MSSQRQWPYNTYLISQQPPALYCPIPKNVCSSLKLWMLKLKLGPEFTVPLNDTLHAVARQHLALGHQPPEAITRLLNDSFSFVFVRNPWDRLVSCFLDKFVKSSNDEGYWRKCRFDIARANGQDHRNITFRHFVHYLAADPQHLVKDEHWRPQAFFLGQVDFDFVGRFETFAEDVRRLQQTLGVDLPVPVTGVNPRQAIQGDFADMPRDGLAAMDAYPGYTQFYTPDLIDAVGDLYRGDVERFGYDVQNETATGDWRKILQAGQPDEALKLLGQPPEDRAGLALCLLCQGLNDRARGALAELPASSTLRVRLDWLCDVLQDRSPETEPVETSDCDTTEPLCEWLRETRDTLAACRRKADVDRLDLAIERLAGHWLESARADMEAGKDASANRTLRQLLTLRPNLAEAHASFGLLLLQQGPAAYPAAVEQLNEASRLDPKNVSALRGMTWMLIETRQQLPTAETLCRRILELAPGDPLATRMLAVLDPSRAVG